MCIRDSSISILYLSDKNTKVQPSSNDQPEIHDLINSKKIANKSDVFLLTYDAYVSNETLLQYGIDNSAQEKFLIQNGFYIYRGVYSVGPLTLPSMSRVLNISKEIKDNLRSITSGNNSANNIFKANGYKTFGVFYCDYFFLGFKPTYDESYPALVLPKQPYRLLVAAIFEGQFRVNWFQKIPHDDYLLRKREILASKIIQPKFMYTHSCYPNHSIFFRAVSGNEIESYKKALSIANEEMQNDIELAIGHNQNAIIIVNGDHGPYLTKNCMPLDNIYQKSEINRLDIQDRYGCFLAIRWPKGANIDHKQIKILQDIFPTVFAYLYNDNSILRSRIGQETIDSNTAGGVIVRNGIIVGGKDDGKPLFESMNN